MTRVGRLAPPRSDGTDAPAMSLRGISKRFGATQALDDVSFTLQAGEVHVVVGENGAGKSTLIKIMTGLYEADTGSIHVGGQPVDINSPADAQALGIAAIYQEPLIFGDLTVAENIFMGHTDRGRVMRWSRLYDDAAEVLAGLDLDLDPRTPASTLTVGEQQAVEIAKAMSQDVRVLIMDEPTAALSAHEVDRLFRQVERLRAAGVAVLFISHRLDEVFAISDRISVFRDGRHIASRPTREYSEELVVREMVGRELGELFVRTTRARDDVVLSVDNLGRSGVFRDVSFDLHAGEVLGLAGLVGAGRTDIGLALFGIEPADKGTILLNGTQIRITSPRMALDHGIAYLSEDRRGLGLSLVQSVASNISLPTLTRYTNSARLIDRTSEATVARHYRDELEIRTPTVASLVEDLSGGNQQKTMLAKWLNTEPAVLILDEPTRGIDVGVKAEVHRLIDKLAREGMAVLMISSDLPEVLAMSDRILVMREGAPAALFDFEDFEQERIITAAVGSR